MVGLLEPFTEVSQKESNSILRIYRPSVHTVASHWFCAMENTVSFGDAVPIKMPFYTRLNSLSICCTRGFSFIICTHWLSPAMRPLVFSIISSGSKGTSISRRMPFRPARLAGRHLSFRNSSKSAQDGFSTTQTPAKDSVGVVLHADDFVLEIDVDDRT